MCLDGRAQEEEAGWRHGGVDGKHAWQVRYIIFAPRMDRGKMEVAALAACGGHWECARPVWDPIQVVAWMGHPALDVRFGAMFVWYLARTFGTPSSRGYE